MADPYLAYLDARGNRTAGATPDTLETLRTRHSAFPAAVLDLLAIQDGEDTLFAKGTRFYSASEISEALSNLRSMVLDEATLPSPMLEFVPFLTTDVCTDVGVFTSQSPVRPGCVAELDYESGQLVWWAASVQEFVSNLRTVVHPNHGLGITFPAGARQPESIYDWPGWPDA
jgi:hypothetical protein